jgi:muconate cycloisomerase
MPSGLAIRRIEIFGVGVPLIGAFKSATSIGTAQRSVVVRVTAGGGAIGLGNIDPSPGYSKETVEEDLEVLKSTLAPKLIGLETNNIHRIVSTMDEVLVDYFEAKAAIEMACVDLSARLAGVPIHAYLGGAIKDRLDFNAWIGMLAPDEAAREALKWRDRGFRSAKVKIGADIAADTERVKAVRAVVGPDFNIRVDANASYDPDSAIKLVRMLSPFGLQLFEQPGAVDDLDGMAKVRREANKVGVRIMADESVTDHASLIEIITSNAADLVKLKVMKQGGFLRTGRMIATAEAAGIGCVIGHGFGLGVNTLAEIMLSATSPNVLDGLECVGPLKMADDILERRLDLSVGSIALPSGPGLGVMLDDDKIRRYGFSAETVT